ncbi:MAG: hypothetical protein AAF560_13115 [Acidobacteriota bacterium]
MSTHSMTFHTTGSTHHGRSNHYDLPMPLSEECEGGGDCYPTDENETGP